MINIELLGTGIALPAKIVLSDDIDTSQGYKPGYTEGATGVYSRHYTVEESATELAIVAITQALEKAQISIDEIDCIISGSGTMEQAIPCNASKVHASLNTSRPIPAFDINMTCLSALMAIDIASSMIDRGQYKKILIYSSEIASVGVQWDNIQVGGLFGDGAAALILAKSACQRKGIRATSFETHSEGYDYCQIKGGGSLHHPSKITGDYAPYGLFEMKGKEIYKLTAKVMEPFINSLLNKSNLSLDDIDWVVPHQASKLAISHMQKKLAIDPAKMVNILSTRGNQIAASIPSALHELLSGGKAKVGDKILIIGTSAGLSLGGMVLEI